MRKKSIDELNRISVETFKKVEKKPICLILENIRSLHNVGSAFRTADIFCLEKIYLTGITGQPPQAEIHKTALGATESVEWEYVHSAMDPLVSLKEKGYHLTAVEQTTNSQYLHNFTSPSSKKIALVFGNEVNGISDEILNVMDSSIEIPQAGTKHSLNVSVCIGIVIWELMRRFFL